MAETPSGVVLYTEPKTTGDGTLDPSYWTGLDVQSAGAVAEALPQPPQNDAEYQKQIETSGSTGPNAPTVSALSAGTPLATEATITWTTATEADSQVKYGTTEGQLNDSAPTDGAYVTGHSVTLTGLTAGTTYYVEVISRDADGNAAGGTTSFTTAAA